MSYPRGFQENVDEFARHMEEQNARQDQARQAQLRAAIARRQAEAGRQPAAPTPPVPGRPAAPAEGPPPSATELDLRDRYLKQYPDTAYGQGEFRRCENGLWRPLPLEDLRSEVFGLAERARPDGVRPSGRLVSAVVELLRLGTAVDDSQWALEPHLLPCANGLLDLYTYELHPHEPHFYVTGALPYAYDPKADPTVWNDFLQSRVPESAEFLREFAGLALTPHTRFESALWLHGPSGCGKSTFLHGLKVLLGHRAGSLSLAELQTGRFDARELAGKTLLICPEQPGADLDAVERVNAFISGEDVTVQPRYRQRQQVRPVAKLAWAFITLPRLKDASSGLFRRVHIVPFPPLPKEKRDTSLKDQLVAEGPGLLNWALGGLSNLLERGRFAPPAAVRAATEHFCQASDLPAEFLAECCERDPNQRAPAKPLYQAYCDWCQANGYRAVANNKISLDWERLGLERVRIEGKSYWRGFRLKGLI